MALHKFARRILKGSLVPLIGKHQFSLCNSSASGMATADSSVAHSIFQLSSKLDELLFADIHGAYDPSSIYNTTTPGRKIKEAVTTKKKPAPVYVGGRPTRWYKDKDEEGNIIKDASGKERGITPKEGSPIGAQAFRHKVLRPGVSYANPGKQWTAVNKEDIQKGEVVHKQPIYESRRLNTHRFLRTKFDLLPGSGLNIKTESGANVDLKRTAKREVFNKYVKQVQDEAGGERLGKRQVADRIQRVLEGEMQNHRNFLAGETRESRAIIKARGSGLLAAKAHPERMAAYKGKLNELVKTRQLRADMAMTHAESRLTEIARKGIHKVAQQPMTVEEGGRRAKDFMRDISSREEYGGGPLTHEQRVGMADVFQRGSTLSKPVTPERVQKLRNHMDKMRDLATNPGTKTLRHRIISGGELFKGTELIKPVKGYPFLKKLGIGAGVAGLVAGGALAMKHKKNQQMSRLGNVIQFELPPEAQRLLDKASKRLWEEGQKVAGPGKIINNPKIRRQMALGRLRRLHNRAAVQKILQHPDLATHPNAPHWKGLYEQKIQEIGKVKNEMRTREHIAEEAAKAQDEYHQSKVKDYIQQGHQSGYSRGKEEENLRGKKVHNEQTQALTKKLTGESDKRASRLKWTIAGSAAAAGTGGYLLGKRNKERQFAVPNKQDPPPWHDIATGGIEGGLAYPASEWAYKKLIGHGVPSPLKKVAVGGAVGGIATGLVGMGLAKILRAKRTIQQSKQPFSEQLSSKLRPIYFVTKDQRTVVAKDRYIKRIKENDLTSAVGNYSASAGVGAALGGILRKKMAIGRATKVGALAGIGVQAATRISTAQSKDKFGERSWQSKLTDKAPWAGGAAVGAGILTKRHYPGLWKSVTKFSNPGQILFDDTYTQADNPAWLQKWAKNKIYGRDYSSSGQAQNIKKWTGRTHRLLRDASIAQTGKPNLDIRGRPRKNEWERPWVAGALTTGALTAGVYGLVKGRHLVRTAPLDTRLGQLREGFLSGDYTKKIPGFVKAGAFARGVKEDFKRIINPKVVKPKYNVSTTNPKTGKPKSDNLVAKEKLEEDTHKTLDKIAHGKYKKDFSSILKTIHFAQVVPDWDIRDQRGRSARIYAPGNQKRVRRPKEWYEKKSNQSKLWEAGIGGTALTGLAAVLYARKRGFNFGKAAARTIGSTGNPVNYTKGEHLEHISGPFSIVKKAKKIEPTEFSSDDVKHAGIGVTAAGAGLGVYSLLRKRSPLPASGALRDIRKAATSHGFTRVHLHDTKNPVSKWWTRTIQEPADRHVDLYTKKKYTYNKIKTKSVVFDPDATSRLSSPFDLGKRNDIANKVRSNKLNEYTTSKKYGLKLPETKPFSGKIDSSWIVKPNKGSDARALTATDFKRHEPDHPLLISYKEDKRNILKQKRLKKISPDRAENKLSGLKYHEGYRRWLTEDALKNPHKFVQQKKINISKEYRVHTIGGQSMGIVSGRHSVKQAIGGAIFGGDKKAGVAAEKALKNVHPSLRKNLMAMDIAKDRKGGWHVIETNPGQDSGFLSPTNKADIRGGNALYKAVTGRHSKAASALGGGAAAIGTVIGGEGLRKKSARNNQRGSI